MIASRDDERWMSAAIALARQAQEAGDVPVGAVVVKNGELVAESANCVVQHGDPTGHAELQAIRAAAEAIDDPRLEGCTLYVTLEPCAMCAGAIVLARVDRLVFGAFDSKAGMVGSLGDIVRHPKLNHRPEVLGGVLADECGALLKAFFQNRR